MQMEQPEVPTCSGVLRAHRLLDTGSRAGLDPGLVRGKPNVLQVLPVASPSSQGLCNYSCPVSDEMSRYLPEVRTVDCRLVWDIRCLMLFRALVVDWWANGMTCFSHVFCLCDRILFFEVDSWTFPTLCLLRTCPLSMVPIS